MQGAALTHSSPCIYILFTLLALLAVLLTACASARAPTDVENADYGPYPEDYQKIAIAHFKTLTPRKALDSSKAQFLNTPNKFIYTQFGRPDKYGYRVCVLVSAQGGREMKSNFLLIRNNQVVEHLYDSGMVRLPDVFCDLQKLAPETKTAVIAAEVAPDAAVDIRGFKYIVCRANGNEIFFAFNAEKHQLLEERDGRVVTTLAMEQLSDTFIIAAGEDNTRVSINRVSGTMLYLHAGTESEGSCELTSRQKF